jgi:N-acetylmuramoyl-L-alanine amidase
MVKTSAAKCSSFVPRRKMVEMSEVSRFGVVLHPGTEALVQIYNSDPMFIDKIALVRAAVLAMMIAGTAGQRVRAEDSAPRHASDGGSCDRSAFRVIVDVGHTATSPGADSARGVPEYEFNLKLADVIAQSLHEAGFGKTVRLVTSGTRVGSLLHRVASANDLHGDLFISIHHDSVPDSLKETWQYDGKMRSYSDRFSGYAIFVSNDNADRAGSLAFGHSLGQELQKHGLHYTPHYTLPLMGRYRHDLIDAEAGVYRYDHLIVLHSTRTPAVLLEAGSIVNRQEELELATAKRRLLVADAVTAAVEEFCANRPQAVVEQSPARKPTRLAITRYFKGIRPASLSHHRRIYSAKN